jgi:hypothetical protein
VPPQAHVPVPLAKRALYPMVGRLLSSQADAPRSATPLPPDPLSPPRTSCADYRGVAMAVGPPQVLYASREPSCQFALPILRLRANEKFWRTRRSSGYLQAARSEVAMAGSMQDRIRVTFEVVECVIEPTVLICPGLPRDAKRDVI